MSELCIIYNRSNFPIFSDLDYQININPKDIYLDELIDREFIMDETVYRFLDNDLLLEYQEIILTISKGDLDRDSKITILSNFEISNVIYDIILLEVSNHLLELRIGLYPKPIGIKVEKFTLENNEFKGLANLLSFVIDGGNKKEGEYWTNELIKIFKRKGLDHTESILTILLNETETRKRICMRVGALIDNRVSVHLYGSYNKKLNIFTGISDNFMIGRLLIRYIINNKNYIKYD